MGVEIDSSTFTADDAARFLEHLHRETDLLAAWFREGHFDEGPERAGYELEAWIVDRAMQPAPLNQQLIERLGSPLVVPELACFNLEFNSQPLELRDAVLRRMAAGLAAQWDSCREVAGQLDAQLLMIGILPTVRESELNLGNMSPLKRYRALNRQVLRQRHLRPLRLDIQGRELLQTEHRDVMLESAATSFQIHLQVSAREAARFYNAATILSAPMVAISANSPYLFGKDLWDETRIPLFEQSTAVDDDPDELALSRNRVTFGSGYMRDSLLPCFLENLDRYPVLLPLHTDADPALLQHLRLHNGTIWRWNRPLIGFSGNGLPHLRLEHRVVPAGPSVPDMIANAAFYFGLVHALARQDPAPESLLDFEAASANFYAAARDGLRAEIFWLEGRQANVRTLILESLLPLAHAGLDSLGLDAADRDHYLGIIEARAESGQNGAAWQRAWVARHGPDMHKLTAAYLAHQASAKPVHGWSV
ncbi:hypothetical protein [Thermithiobacillus plumbiphilus]|uniref:Glutamate--cysteine ligase n=1 Tax=Thermithiobacillus plumbiphilus TaxID=1729899 RepID=A0ABU9D7V8_9PROT